MTPRTKSLILLARKCRKSKGNQENARRHMNVPAGAEGIMLRPQRMATLRMRPARIAPLELISDFPSRSCLTVGSLPDSCREQSRSTSNFQQSSRTTLCTFGWRRVPGSIVFVGCLSASSLACRDLRRRL